MIEFDVETTGLQPYSGRNEAFLWIFMSADGERVEAIPYSPSGSAIPGYGIEAEPPPGTVRTLQLTHHQKNKERIQAWFDEAIEDPDGIRAWNAKFDRGFSDPDAAAARAAGFRVPGDERWHDGMLTAHAVDERRSVALKAVAGKLFGEEAADPQKRLKAWLNAENARRRKVEADAKKAKNGNLKVAYEEVVCFECEETWQDETDGGAPDYQCPMCGSLEPPKAHKSRKRAATEDERAEVIEEAKLYRREDGSFVYANYSHVPREIMDPYACEDVILTRKVCEVYASTLANKPDLARVVEFERQAMDALYAVEKRGLPSRAVEYRRLEQEVIDNLTALEDKVHALAEEGDPVIYAKELGVELQVKETPAGRELHYEGTGGRLEDFNPNSTPQILAALTARGADLSFMSEKDGKLGADKDNLMAVNDALAAAILEYRSEAKVLSTYVRPMIGRSYVSALNTHKEPFIAPDSRIHANYRQVGARTGRMSCSDPNMQNQPRDDLRLRYNIVADPGYKLVTCDLSNIEMVLFAAYCGPGRLLDGVRNGDDLHTLTAQMVGLRDRSRPGGGIETARQQGKVFNFTIIYGGGYRSIKRYFRCTMAEARLMKERYLDAYPEVGKLQNRIDYKLQDQGYIRDSLFSGRRWRVDPRDSYKATNYLVQGTAASLLKAAMVLLHKDGCPMVALIHDEILAHVREDEAQEWATLIEKRMTQAAEPGGQLWLPEVLNEDGSVKRPEGAVVPLRAEADIVDRWSDAKPLKDKATGRKYLFTPDWAGGEKRWLEEAA